MDSLFTERKALQEHIAWIREERRRLTDEYWRVIERIRELDNKIDNVTSNEFVENIAKILSEQKQTMDSLKELIPKIPVEVAVAEWKQRAPNEENEDTDDSVITSKQIEEFKDFEDKYVSPIKRRGNQDNTSIAHEIAAYLKEVGVPLRAKDIREHMEAKGYRLNNPTNYLNRAMEVNKNVVRIGFGMYQYNTDIE